MLILGGMLFAWDDKESFAHRTARSLVHTHRLIEVAVQCLVQECSSSLPGHVGMAAMQIIIVTGLSRLKSK